MMGRPTLALVLLAISTAAFASPAPVLPCGSEAPVPAPAALLSQPQAEIWTALDWRPPACIPWRPDKFRFVAAVSGLVEAASTDDLLTRLGAISATAGLRYWSVSEQGWRVLIEAAFAVKSESSASARPDFSLADMRSGAALHFREKDNRTSEAVTYRMRVLKASPDEIVVESVNMTAINSFGVTLMPVGSLRLAYLARRITSNQWSLYLVSAADSKSSRLVSLGKESYLNRVRAIFGHIGKIPPEAGES